MSDFKPGQLRSDEDRASLMGRGFVLGDFILAAAGGTRIPVGVSCSIEFAADHVVIGWNTLQERVSYGSVQALQVSGSTTKTNLGMLGGGFGAVGAAEGILAAAVINTLTTRTKRYAVLRIVTNTAEYVFSSSVRDGSVLEGALTWVQVRIRTARQSDVTDPKRIVSGIADEIRKLADLRDEGILTEAEFSAAKAKLIGL